MIGSNFKFPKAYKLTNKKEIATLLSKGEAFFVFPIKAVVLPMATIAVPYQILVTVPKKRVPLSTKRNLLKRRIREAFRTQQQIVQPLQLPLHIAFIYITEQIIEQQEIQKSIIKILNKIATRYDASNK